MQRLQHLVLMGLLFCSYCLLSAEMLSAETMTYSYDAMGRLTQASYENGAEIEYAYDKTGNRLNNTVRAEEPPNHPPNVPSNPSIADGATGVSLGPLLSWNGGDSDPDDTVVYEIYFGGPGDLLLVATQTDTSYVPDLLDPLSTYFWQIVASDNHEATTEGSVWRFTTGGNENPVPEAGTLVLLIGGLLGLVGIMRRRKM